jgi:putative MATE family efflux protein
MIDQKVESGHDRKSRSSSPGVPPGTSTLRRSDVMGALPVGRLLWLFSLPGVVAMLVTATYNVVDTIFVGGLGHEAIAALTVVFPIQMIIIAVSIGTGIGAASLVSRRLGEGRTDEANHAAGQTLSISLILGLLMALFGHTAGRLVLHTMGASDLIADDSYAYLVTVASGAVFSVTNITTNNLVRAEGNPKLPMISMITGALANIGLDPVFIYRLGLGVRGAALATVLAQAVSTVIVLLYLFGQRTDFRIKLVHYWPRFDVWAKIYSVGGPHMLMSLVGSIAIAVVVRIASPFGDAAVATYGIIFRIAQFGFLPCVGISSGALPLVGYNFGAREYPRVQATIRKTALFSTAITLSVALLALIFPRLVVSIFNRDPGFLASAAPAVRIAFAGFMFVGAQVSFASFFQGLGRGLPSAITGISRQLVLLIPTLMLFSHLFGERGIWSAIPVADTGAFLLSYVWAQAVMRRLGITLWKRAERS